MRLSTNKSSEGFTLIEGIVVVFIFSMLAYGLLVLVSSMLTNSSKQEGLLYNADQARRVSFQIMQELRNAQTSNIGSYALSAAGSHNLTLYYNLDGGIEIERIRYYLQNGTLKKGVLKPTGNPLTYNPANEVVTDIQYNVANDPSTPLFYYYSGSYTGATDNFLAQPVNVTNVRYIKLNLQITNVGGQAGTGVYTVTAGATVRNLKTNLDE